MQRTPNPRQRGRRARRGFNLVELLIALSISATLLTATMVALDASFKAYQQTTETASTHTIARIAVDRIAAMIRTSTDFGPPPASLTDRIVATDHILFERPGGDIWMVEWDADDEALYLVLGTDPDVDPRYLILEGVVEQTDDDGDQVMPFTLEYEKGTTLYRATIDLMVVPDDNMSVEMEGNSADAIRLVTSAMPRTNAF